MKNLKFYVSEDNILKGMPDYCYKCPVALSLKEIVLPGYVADVETKYINIRNKNNRVLAKIPISQILQKDILNFDINEVMSPKVYVLKVTERQRKYFCRKTI